MVEVKHLSKDFRGPHGIIHALDDVDLNVNKGEFIAVQGPSGCGKTTLLLTVGGLLAPDQGTVFLNGNNPYTMTPDDRARFRAKEIGFVFQQFHLIPYLSVVENILVPAIALPQPDMHHRAFDLINRFNLSERKDHKSSELSTGERQRTALARALLNNPKLILADEPTGNLDRENADIVLGYLREFAQGGGSILLVTHDTTAVSYADRTLRLITGKISNT